MMKRFLQVLFAMTFVLCFACMFACDNKKEEVCEHDYVAETVVEPTCTQDGYTKYKCSKCNDVKNDNVTPKLGHAMSDWAQKTPATCTEAEVLEQHCTRTGCDYSDTKAGAPELGHDVKWTVVTEPTCETDGTKDGKCSRCDYEEKGVVADKLGHAMSEWTQKTPATCTEAEVLEQHCTRKNCDYSDTKAGAPKLGHDYQISTTDPDAKPATCEEGGKEVKICSHCGDKQTRDLGPNGHTPDGIKEEVHESTCEEQGYTTYHCVDCGNDYNDDYEDALGHDMQLEKTVTASCRTEGYDLKKCSRCDHTEKENVVDKLHHHFNAEGVCESGCDMSIDDKLTWIYTPLDVTYIEDKDRLAMAGGNGKDKGVTNPLTVSAEVISKMYNDGCTSFTVKMIRSRAQQKAYLEIKYGEGTPEANNAGLVEMTFDITEEMCENGLNLSLTYADNSQTNPGAWGETIDVVDGFDFDISFVKEFDINDKSMWLASGFDKITYSAEKGKWVINDADPGTEQVVKQITIKADVFNALASNLVAFKIKMYIQNDGENVVFGINNVYGGNGYSTSEIAITDDMRANGYTATFIYADQNQRDGKTAPHVTGFDMEIEFMEAFDLSDRSRWLTSAFSTFAYSAEKDKWVVNEGAGRHQNNITISADVFKALSADVASFKVYIYSQGEGQRPQFGFHDGMQWLSYHRAHSLDNPLMVEITITDAMRANGFRFDVLYFDEGDKYEGTEEVTGFDMDIVFVNA